MLIIHIWKEAARGISIYLASQSSINPEYYGAARADGLMGNSFEQSCLFNNSLNQSVSEVLENCVYQIGIAGGRFSYATAVGLFKNVMAAVLVFSSHMIARKLGQASFYE